MLGGYRRTAADRGRGQAAPLRADGLAAICPGRTFVALVPPTSNVTFLTGDCREVLRTLPDVSVHCCVTSPPYWGLRSYTGDPGMIDAPVSTSIISAATLETTSAQNYGDLLRATPGLNVIQLSARDVQVTSRSPGNTLTNSQLVLVDGSSAYLDFFGLVLWDLLPTNFDDVEQIEVVRGPASAVWGANAMTGAVNIITKPPRESVGTTVTLSGGYVDRNDGSGTGRGAGSLFGANATVTRAPNDRVSYRVSAGYFTSAAFARPTGRIPVIDDPRQPGQTVGGAFYPLDSAAAAVGTGFANRGTSQPKFDVRVDQELSHGTLTYAGGVAGTDGLIHSGIGPFDMQSGTYLGYGKLTYTRGALRMQFFTNVLNGQAPNLLLPDLATGRPLQLDFRTQTYDGEIGHSVFLGTRHRLTYGGNVRRLSPPHPPPHPCIRGGLRGSGHAASRPQLLSMDKAQASRRKTRLIRYVNNFWFAPAPFESAAC